MKRRFMSMMFATIIMVLSITTNLTGLLYAFAVDDVATVSGSVNKLYADFNGDGDTTIADAVVLARYIAEDSSVEYTKIWDLTDDNRVTADDLATLLIFMKGMELLVSDNTTGTTTETTTTETTTETTITETSTSSSETTTSTTETTTTPAETTESLTDTTTTLTETTTSSTETTTETTTSSPETTTTTTETTTSSTETTTSTSESTTSSTETATTTTETTTTTTSTETTTSTTTTESTTSTETTTSTTEDLVEKRLELVQEVFESISVKDTAIPKYAGPLYEAKEVIFLTQINGTKYCYTLLADSKTSVARLVDNINLIKGAHVWKYTGSEKALSINASLPSTTGKTYVDPDTGKEKSYKLKAYKSIHYSLFVSLPSVITGPRYQTSTDIMHYDYNLNGLIDTEDITIIARYWSCYLYNPFWGLNETAFNRLPNSIQENGFDNVVVYSTKSTAPVEYALNVSCGDLADDFEGATYGETVQILPVSYYDFISSYTEEDEDVTDEVRDYIAWDYTIDYWANVSKNSQNWIFRAGVYGYLLNEDGTHYMDVIKTKG